eukprot:350975-Chlamydomonas_euryale.AAC.7
MRALSAAAPKGLKTAAAVHRRAPATPLAVPTTSHAAGAPVARHAGRRGVATSTAGSGANRGRTVTSALGDMFGFGKVGGCGQAPARCRSGHGRGVSQPAAWCMHEVVPERPCSRRRPASMALNVAEENRSAVPQPGGAHGDAQHHHDADAGWLAGWVGGSRGGSPTGGPTMVTVVWRPQPRSRGDACAEACMVGPAGLG